MAAARQGADGARRKRILVFGSYDQVRHPRVAVLRAGLAEAGHEVEELNRPLGMSTAEKVDAARSVTGTVRFAVSVVRSWRELVRAGRAAATPDVVVVGYLGHLDVHLAKLLWPRSTIVLDHMVGLADTVRDRNLGRGPVYRLLDATDRAALRRADLVVVDTDEQLQQLPARSRAKAVVVEVGATTEWFRPSAAPATLPLKVCFVGLYTPLQGAPVIGAAIKELAGDDRVEFTMVGAGQELEATRRAAGGAEVTWLDWVPGHELPALLAAHHVGLGIFGTTPKAFRVVPNKVYQSLAAGNVVVTSDTPVQRRVLGDLPRYVPPGDPAALAAELRRLAGELAEGPEVPPFPSPQHTARFRPGSVVGPLLGRLGADRLSPTGHAPSATPDA